MGKGQEPKKKLAILTDMDPRLDVLKALDLKLGDAVIIRNAGAVVTDDVIRSLTLAVHKLGVKKILVVGSSNNPLEKLDFGKFDFEIRKKIGRDVEGVTGSPIGPWLKVFENMKDNVIEQIVYLRRNQLLKGVEVRGVIYSVESGKVEFIE
jgi:carbonic anhydrase